MSKTSNSNQLQRLILVWILTVFVSGCAPEQIPSRSVASRCRNLSAEPFVLNELVDWQDAPDDKIGGFVAQALNSGASQAIIEMRLLQAGVGAGIYWADFDGDDKNDGVITYFYSFGVDPNFHSGSTVTLIKCSNSQYELELLHTTRNQSGRRGLVAIEDFHNNGREAVVLQSFLFSLDGACDIAPSLIALGPDGIYDQLLNMGQTPSCPGTVTTEDIDADGIKEIVVVGKEPSETPLVLRADRAIVYKVAADYSITQVGGTNP